MFTAHVVYFFFVQTECLHNLPISSNLYFFFCYFIYLFFVMGLYKLISGILSLLAVHLVT